MFLFSTAISAIVAPNDSNSLIHRFFKVASLPTRFLFAANLFDGHFLRQDILFEARTRGLGQENKLGTNTPLGRQKKKNNLFGFEVWNIHLDIYIYIYVKKYIYIYISFNWSLSTSSCFGSVLLRLHFQLHFHVNSKVCLWSRDPAWNLEHDAPYLHFKKFHSLIPYKQRIYSWTPATFNLGSMRWIEANVVATKTGRHAFSSKSSS